LKYAFISDFSGEFPVKLMCKVFEVSTSGYYDWCGRDPSDREMRKLETMMLIELIHKNSKERYGAPRIYQALIAQGANVCQTTVSRWMKESGLRAKSKRKFRVVTTDSNHKLPVAENILNREFDNKMPGEVLTSDITYIPTDEGWLYLAITLDLGTRKAAGWSMDKTMTEKLVSDALRMAIGRVNLKSGAIHHSDRGSQYASSKFQSLLAANALTPSMSRKGNCWDNAPTESFFHSLKTELIYFENYRTREEARKSIFEYIEVFYNRERLHSSINYKSPIDYEESFVKCA
jgi:transposase InsO family protein